METKYSDGVHIGAQFEKLDYLIQRMHSHLDSRDTVNVLLSIYKWDIYYLRIAKLVSTKSKDPSTQVGAVIVRPDWSLCSIGFNGFPKKMPDNPELYSNREEKYSRVIHAEINAHLFSQDTSLEGYTLYTYPFTSCDRCCVQMIQAGITRFVAPMLSNSLKERWGNSLEKTKKYIKECNLVLDLVDMEDLV